MMAFVHGWGSASIWLWNMERGAARRAHTRTHTGMRPQTARRLLPRRQYAQLSIPVFPPDHRCRCRRSCASGRTGRAGARGLSTALLTPSAGALAAPLKDLLYAGGVVRVPSLLCYRLCAWRVSSGCVLVRPRGSNDGLLPCSGPCPLPRRRPVPVVGMLPARCCLLGGDVRIAARCFHKQDVPPELEHPETFFAGPEAPAPSKGGVLAAAGPYVAFTGTPAARPTGDHRKRAAGNLPPAPQPHKRR
jgi:hypothetical protein